MLNRYPSWLRSGWPILAALAALEVTGCSTAARGNGTATASNAGGGTDVGGGLGVSTAGNGGGGGTPPTSGAAGRDPVTVGGATSGGASSAAGNASASGGASSAAGNASASGGASSAAGNASASGGAAGGTGGYWKPAAATTWQWQLTGTIDTTVDVQVYDIDGFDNDASIVKTLHEKGRRVICYLSVGSYEDWRSDAKAFPASVLGNDYPGWPGERFVDIRAQALRNLMSARFDACKQKGFDGIEPDNMDVYSADSGFPLTKSDGIDYANWLASEAHARGLNIGQKNAPELATTLQASFDWILTEDCYDQGWCADVKTYVDHNKPIFMSEYTDTGVDFGAACTWARPKTYSPILKGRDLDAPVQFCP